MTDKKDKDITEQLLDDAVEVTKKEKERITKRVRDIKYSSILRTFTCICICIRLSFQNRFDLHLSNIF